MQENPCSGYLVRASAFKEMLCPRDRGDYQEALDNYNFDVALKIIVTALPAHCAKPSELFILAVADTGDEELELGIPYVHFDQEALYELQPKAELVTLLGMIEEKPSYHTWSIFG